MTSTRTPKTEMAYAIKAMQIRSRAARDLGYFSHFSMPPMTIVDHLIGRKPTIAKNTWKQYKNALRSHFQGLANESNESVAVEELQAAIAALDSEPSTGSLKYGTRTSATKQKHFKQTDLDKFVDYLAGNVGRHKFANALRTWLLAAQLTGLRPSEWESAGLTEIAGLPCLTLRNGKATNGRANGEFRTLDLSKATAADMEVLLEMFAMLEGHLSEMRFDELQTSLTHYMKRATRACFGRRKKYPTLYSLRHQFAADAKLAGHTKEEVAAILGHATDETAGRHYSRAVSGQSAVRVQPVDSEVRRVRAKARPYPYGPRRSRTFAL
ncbi:hypothetical protein LMG28614_06185 [Paraburkholderia ultramafica]|uniref:Tyr recombinase domain-containing protein n=1 Tax=Paraburkholderia ultramafica TaxID=1544867 RepID=A0A6S7CBI4_9BURK|nr:site-specific integrase [Paraburkholderia ultramafica]CAB3805332.1 hypothetical protein LMG28614_06185 [Paraburkholderia ultramafica]